MILVTGATGHVGNVLVRALLARGEQVRALVLPGEACTSLEGLDVEHVEGNVLDTASLDQALEGVDLVYHLAGIIAIAPGQEALMQRVNVNGVRNVARAALKAGVRRMVHVSSIHAFARMPHGVMVDETTPLVGDCPVGDYDRTKAEGTRALLEVVQEGLDAVVVCPTGIIGPNDYLGSEMGYTIRGYAKQKLHVMLKGAFDFVDVRDVVTGLLLAAEKGRTGEIYILAGTLVKMSELKQLTQEVIGRYSPHVYLPLGLALVLAKLMQPLYAWTKTTPRFTPYSLRTITDNAKFSASKAQRELGYHHRPLRETLKDTLTWYKNHFSRKLSGTL